MTGTLTGGRQSAKTNKERHGEDFYKRIGAIGGKRSNTGGYAYAKARGNMDLIRESGRKGGLRSRRVKK